MSESTPKCCQNCENLKKNAFCSQYTNCPAWRIWFRNEWARIRRAADRIRKNNEREGPKK